MLIGVNNIIQQSITLYFKHFKQIWVYLAISLIPTIVITLIALIEISLEIRMITPKTLNDAALIVLYVAGSIVSLWAYLALIKVFDLILKNQPAVWWKDNLSAAVKTILPGILLFILTGLIVLAGSLLFVIPGIIFMVWYQFSVYALVADNEHGLVAMKNSKNLVTGRWWAVLWRLLAPSALFAIGAGILQWVVTLIISWIPKIPEATLEVITIMTDNIINLLLLPLLIAAGLILYENLKANPVNTALEKM